MYARLTGALIAANEAAARLAAPGDVDGASTGGRISPVEAVQVAQAAGYRTSEQVRQARQAEEEAAARQAQQAERARAEAERAKEEAAAKVEQQRQRAAAAMALADAERKRRAEAIARGDLHAGPLKALVANADAVLDRTVRACVCVCVLACALACLRVWVVARGVLLKFTFR